jgi:hypothetical protein
VAVNPLLAAALWYAEQGFAVFPCGLNKSPLIPTSEGGNGYHDATTDADQIKAWWSRWPEASIGLPCAPNGLLVLDVDQHEGDGAATLQALLDAAGAEMPQTPTQTTGGGGVHYVFAAPDWQPSGKAGHQLDIRSNGYIVVAPSPHPSGREYVWRRGLALGKRALAEVPDWLEAIIRKHRTASPPAPPESYDQADVNGQRLSDFEVCRAALKLLPDHCCDDYAEWVAVGQALHSVSDELLAHWDGWSQNSAKYDAAACERKWRGFHRDGGVSIGTLVAWARETDPEFLRPGWRGGQDGASAPVGGGGAARQPAPAPEGQPAPERPRLREVDPGEAEPGNGLPVIPVNGKQLDEQVDMTLAALVAANEPPRLFVRSGLVTRVRPDEDSLPVIDRVDVATLRERAARVAHWVKLRKATQKELNDGAGEWVGDNTAPTKDIVESVLVTPNIARSFPPLVAVTQVPTLRNDGTVVVKRGYDQATKLFYQPPKSLQVPRLPDKPTRDDAVSALARVWDLFSEFPYVEPDTDRCAILALLLTPVLRAAINGPVPIAIIDAPQQGTGKSLIAETIASIITTDYGFHGAPRAGEDAEWRKALTTYLSAGNTIIGFDNVEDVLSSGDLARAITAPIWKDRILGRSEEVRVPVRVTWMATGNNVRVGGDIARRCYRIRIDAKMAEPWERKGFKYPDLRGYALAHRGALLADLLTAASAWYLAGQPDATGLPNLGSFEDWRRIIGGILQWTGHEGFLSNLRELYREADQDSSAWEAFLWAWKSAFPTAITTKGVSDAVDDELHNQSGATLAEDRARTALAEAFPEAYLEAKSGRVNRRSFGKAITSRIGRRYGIDGIRIERCGQDQHRQKDRFTVVTDPEGGKQNGAASNPLAERVSEGTAPFAPFNPSNALREDFVAPTQHDIHVEPCLRKTGQTVQYPNDPAPEAALDVHRFETPNGADDYDPWADDEEAPS